MTRPLRVLFLSNLFPPYARGGLENRCQETAAALRKRGHTVKVLTSRYGVQAGGEDAQGVIRSLYLQTDIDYYKPIDFFLKRPAQEKANRQILMDNCLKFQPDLLVIWGMWNLSRRLPALAEQLLPGRVAYFVGSYWPVDEDPHLAYWKLPARMPLTNLLKRPLRSLALAQLRKESYPPALDFEHAVCSSRYMRDEMVRAGALPDTTLILYPGVDPKPYLQASPSRERQQDELLHLLYFGSLVEHKGVHIAIESLRLLKEWGCAGRLDLTILGSGHPDYEARLHDLAAGYGLGERIHFVPQVPRDQIPDRLRDCDCFLFTSLWAEPFGRSIVEAMLAGLVVIGSDTGGSREIFEYYDHEMLFQPGDARRLADLILRVLNDPELRARLAEAGRRVALEHFTLERMIDQIEDWFWGIINDFEQGSCEGCANYVRAEPLQG
jgi:glycosyltransferase involved in cell wall biosynthesis